jgi:hypothetical protein
MYFLISYLHSKDGSATFEYLKTLKQKAMKVNLEKHVWEGWKVQDFIDELESSFNMIQNNQSYINPFKDELELRIWLMENQPYYKKHIPEVFKYFKNKLNKN